ncbi:hypothetical protein POL68_14925 [Stigmatella sp. ncwal1]|uniref:Uncharacterized protein n=1 Tax=Stigmatella ashevillensis TaxID=2995309 RepID=A0ABT5D7W8_9BACT|nr:hypothetical protein [Stigmatella ashevillena]MDC0709763.1 hypothetical protein [Stigmatella ashevillena]
MTSPQKTPELPEAGHAQAHNRFGWTLLLVSMTFGTTLEALEAFRWVPLMSDDLKHRLWALAHFHGAALGLLNLVYVRWENTPTLGEAARKRASLTLLLGSAAIPLGFLLGGIAHPEGDPSLGVFLAPIGALLVLHTAAAQTFAAWRRPS